MTDIENDFLHIYVCIGRLTLCWAHIENAIDNIITLVYVELNGKDIEPEAPIALSRKISFVRKVAKRLDIFSPRKDDILQLMDKVESASQQRHDIIHGIMEKNFEKQEIKITRLLRRENTYRKVSFPMDDLISQVKFAETIANQSYELALSMCALVDPDSVRDESLPPK